MFNNRKRRVAVAAAALTASAALVLTGCSTAAAPSPRRPTTPTRRSPSTSRSGATTCAPTLYDEAIAAFNEEYPNITVNSSFLGLPEFWEKRQTEAAGGGLPDVMQFDYSYLRQYSENGLLLDLEPYLGNIIDTEPLRREHPRHRRRRRRDHGHPDLDERVGHVHEPEAARAGRRRGLRGRRLGGLRRVDSSEVTEAGAGALWGGTDYTGRIQNFEIQQRAQGEDLFTEDGEPNFTEEDLAAFWEQGVDARAARIPQQRLEEIYPVSGFDAALTTSELTWDNFGAGYLGNLGEEYTELGLVAPPVTEDGAKDLYLKPSMLHSIASTTEHPEAAATLVNFLVNSPEAGAIFGTNRGLPASETMLEGAELDPLGQQIRDYEESIADRLGNAPPVPIVGYGTLEEKFRQLGQELGFGTVTVDDAVAQFFNEMDVVLNQ